jgi:hypothetical protein
MGKGGCFFDFLDMGLHVIRRMIGCVICFFCAGPILIIVGIVLLAAPNNRQSDVNQFNNAVASFNTTAAIINNGSGIDRSSSTTFSPTTQQVQITGNTDNVVANRPTTFFQSSGSVSGGDLISLKTRFGSQQFINNFSVPNVAAAQITTVNLNSCSSQSSCDSACFNKAPSGCSYRANYCYRCQSTCQWTTYPSSTTCLQLAWSNTSGWSPTGSYCDYPFNTQKFTCSYFASQYFSSVMFRATNDPYVILQAITDGSASFGLTAAQQRGLGIAMIGVGCALFALAIFACVLLKNACTQHEHKARVYEAFGRTYSYPAGYVPVQQQYPPMQQPYGAAVPQPGYQPQQAYPQQAYPQQPYPQQPYQQAYPQQPYPQQQPPNPYGSPPPQPGYAPYPPQPYPGQM